MKESTLKTKYLYVLQEPFSLDTPYADRQRVVIVTDELVGAERQVRARLAEETEHAPLPADGGSVIISGQQIERAAGESHAAVAGRHLRRSLRGLQDAGAGMKRALDDRARSALRRQHGILMIGRTESSVLRLDQGHPLKNVLYVGHPAKPELYFPAAEFHRRVFEHKFVEAVTLLTSLGASRIIVKQVEEQTRERERSVKQKQGQTREKDQPVKQKKGKNQEDQTQEKERASLAMSYGFTRARDEKSGSHAMFQADYPGNRNPFVPDGLCWYPDEQTWQMIAHARIVGGAEKTSLEVKYTTNYGIDTRIVMAAWTCGVKIGGKFVEQRDIVWQLDAEFPSLAG
jgi:hypothetical protein